MNRTRTALIAAGALVLAGLYAAGRLSGLKEKLTAEQRAIAVEWKQVEATIAQRAAVAPALEATVGQNAPQSAASVRALSETRSALAAAHTRREKIEINNRIDIGIARVLLAAEYSPALKTNADFLRIQDELAAAENRVAVARRKYNEAVQRYNTTIVPFPNNVAAWLFGFRRDDAYFRTEGASQAPPEEAR